MSAETRSIDDLSIFDYTEETIKKRIGINVVNFKNLQKDLMELKQKFDNYEREDILDLLNSNSSNQRTLSSNAIEEIFGTYTELHRLATGKDIAKTHTEEQILGYYNAVREITQNNLPFTLTNLIHYHRYFENSDLKEMDNVLKNAVTQQISFKPVSYQVSENYLQRIIKNFENTEIDEWYLCKIVLFNYDFLCIHPFMDGNGRVSRLSLNWLLQKLHLLNISVWKV